MVTTCYNFVGSFNRLKHHPIYDIQGGSIRTISGADSYGLFPVPIRFEQANDHQAESILFYFETPTQSAAIPITELCNFMDRIERLSYEANYSRIKENNAWLRLYNADYRQVTFMDQFGNIGLSPNLIHTIPCHYCGIVLPVELIQIEHQMPQAHGNYAILKILHSIFTDSGEGLTLQSAHGAKNSQAHKFIIPHQEFTPIPVKGRTFGSEWGNKPPDDNRDQRYTLNSIGRLVLSLMIVHWGKANLRQKCIHSILNMAPSCSNCNSKKSAGVHVG